MPLTPCAVAVQTKKDDPWFSDDRAEQERAAGICWTQCTAREECKRIQDSLSVDEASVGVWAGMLPPEVEEI